MENKYENAHPSASGNSRSSFEISNTGYVHINRQDQIPLLVRICLKTLPDIDYPVVEFSNSS